MQVQDWLAPRGLAMPLTVPLAAFWHEGGCQIGAMPTEHADWDTRLGTVDDVVACGVFMT